MPFSIKVLIRESTFFLIMFDMMGKPNATNGPDEK
jgi:hypothetical protein